MSSSLKMFEPFRIKHLALKNRVFRSAIGGRMASWAGFVTPYFREFEQRFAKGGVAGIISTTMTVDERRWSPLQYPSLAEDKFIPEMRDAIREIRSTGTRYFIQIGDPGYHTQTSLFPEAADGKSASTVFDLLYGYRTLSSAMSEDEIARSIARFADGARRARACGCDGIEITASKGYLIHQFLNPAINRRRDQWGGSAQNRFRFLREIVNAVRLAVGTDFVLGVRLSAVDCNYLPVNVRLPWTWPLRDFFVGNDLRTTVGWAKELEALGIDYLHVTRGYGFINPKENPGDWPVDQVRMFCNSTRHLSWKAKVRATLMNLIPRPLLRLVTGIGWRHDHGENARYAQKFKQALSIPVMVNGGFQDRDLIERTLGDGKADLVSMARPLLANPDLLRVFADGKAAPERPCSFCNKCVVSTAVLPLGCYDERRFASRDEMERQIIGTAADESFYGEAAKDESAG